MQILLNKYKWFSRGGVHVCGYCYDENGKLLIDSSLCDYFSNIHCVEDLKNRLRIANGLFAVIIQKNESLIAAIDRIRRFPLFYTTEGILSDNPDLLSSSGEWDILAKAFYEASGAVLPGHTLLQDIRQLPPSSYAEFSTSGCNVYSYASFLSTYSQEKNISLDELDVVMTSVFKRLITSVGNRQLVIPLTSGNDSRLILCMLRKLGYDNVVCYTVEGVDGDEWGGAHKAALQLGYPHYRVDMQDETVRQLCYANLEDFDKYYRYVGAYTNFCWLYDYVAIRYLEKHHKIAKDAIFVPGHSGDMLAGSHLTKANMREQMPVRSMVQRMINVGFEYKKNKIVYKELAKYFDRAKREGYTDYSAYQNWIVQHRQAHNIVNSIHAYDFCGYEVRLPLWDNALYNLFSHLPYESLFGCRLYIQYVKRVFAQYALCVNDHIVSVYWPFMAFRKYMKYILPNSIVRLISKTTDSVGEVMLSQPLWEELSQWKGYSHFYTNSNELLLQWYLMKVYMSFHS